MSFIITIKILKVIINVPIEDFHNRLLFLSIILFGLLLGLIFKFIPDNLICNVNGLIKTYKKINGGTK
jgi:hypothetical protein